MFLIHSCAFKTQAGEFRPGRRRNHAPRSRSNFNFLKLGSMTDETAEFRISGVAFRRDRIPVVPRETE